MPTGRKYKTDLNAMTKLRRKKGNFAVFEEISLNKGNTFLPSFLPAKERVIQRSVDRVSQLMKRHKRKCMAPQLTPTTLRSSTLSSLREKRVKKVFLPTLNDIALYEFKTNGWRGQKN
jgi:hypothetical protein